MVGEVGTPLYGTVLSAGQATRELTTGLCDEEDLANGELVLPLSADLERIPCASNVDFVCFDGDGSIVFFDFNGNSDIGDETSHPNNGCLDVNVDCDDVRFKGNGENGGFGVDDTDDDDDSFDGENVNFEFDADVEIKPLDARF